MAQIFANAARAVLAAGIASGDTTVTIVSGGSLFPVVASPDFARAVLQDANGIEIVLITAHTANATSFTVTRAQEGTTARSFDAGSVFGVRVTAADMDVAVSVTPAGSQTLTNKTFGDNPTFSAGTANAVAFLNGSKVLTTGSALTFDGATVTAGNSGISGGTGFNSINSTGNSTFGTQSGTYGALSSGDAYVYTAKNIVLMTDNAASSIKFSAGGSAEQMRLTSTGLGIGTSSPSVRLQLEQAANSAPVTLLRLNNSGTTGGGPGIASRIAFTAGATALGYVQGSNFASGAAGLQFSGDGTNAQATLDSSGNLGLGVTPSA